MRALAATLAMAVLTPPSFASDLSRLRLDSLERGLPALRGGLDHAPGRAAFVLGGERQRLRSLRVESSRDPRLPYLSRELQRLEWQAERLERRGERAARRAVAARERLPVPGYLRPPYDTDLSGETLPIGAGRLYILIQNGLRDAEMALAAGHRRAAALDLARAESHLQALKGRFAAGIVRDDPNLVAAERQLAALRASLAAIEGG